MPNLWTKATQKIAEAFSGPRTRDTEFEMKVDEMKYVEKGILSLRLIFQNFLNYTVSIRNYCRDVTNSLKIVYDKRSPFSILSNDISDAHTELEKIYDDFYNNVNKLNGKTTEWAQLFTNAKSQIEKREVLRKTYDHYDEKLEKVYKSKQEKSRKSANESAKDIEFVQRNENKFKKATEDYVKISEFTFETIQNILDKRFDMINPVLSDFVDEERNFFTNASNIFKKFEGISNKFKHISRKVEKSSVTYDPCKYIRGGEIIQKDRSFDKSNVNVDHQQLRKTISQEEALEAENMRQRSKSNMPGKVVVADDTPKKVDNIVKKMNMSSTEKITGDVNSNDTGNYPNLSQLNNNNNFRRRESEFIYQEFSGFNDQFSSDVAVNRNQSQTHTNSQIPFNNNENLVNNVNSGNMRGSQMNSYNNQQQFQNSNNFRISSGTPNTNTNFNNPNFNFNNPNSGHNNNFNLNTNMNNNTNPYMNTNMNINVKNRSETVSYKNNNNTNNNFDFDNIFFNNTNQNNNMHNMNSNNNNKNSNNAFNLVNAVPSNIVYGVVTGIPKNIVAGIASNISNSNNTSNTNNTSNNNFNFNNPQMINQGIRNSMSNFNNNPKGANDDLFKDLF